MTRSGNSSLNLDFKFSQGIKMPQKHFSPKKFMLISAKYAILTLKQVVTKKLKTPTVSVKSPKIKTCEN